MIESYYSKLAPFYRYLFQDWEKSVVSHAQILDCLIREFFDSQTRPMLDAACGIGNQGIGLAQLGYQIVASDISAIELDLAMQEANKRSLNLRFELADIRRLRQSHQDVFDLVIACDNAIPHLLSKEDILLAFQELYACTNEGGGCILSVRDYANMDLGGRKMYPRTVQQTQEARVM